MPISFTLSDIAPLIAGSRSRFDLWVRLLRARPMACAAEIGVWKGDFAQAILASFSDLTKYYMIDPWAQLPDWNKPWQHGSAYEPTLVCPFAIYFAEAMRLPFVALPHKQFLIQKAADTSFSFVDLTGTYSDLSLKKLSQS